MTTVVQPALVPTPAKSLADHASVTAMTGIAAISPLDTITLPALSDLTATCEPVFDARR